MQTHLGTSAEISETDIEFDALNDADWLYLEGLSCHVTLGTTGDCPAKTTTSQRQGAKIAVSFADPAVVKFGREDLMRC